MTLFGYEPATNAVTELIKSNGTAMRAASAGPGGIVYEQFGQIQLYDLTSERPGRCPSRSMPT